MGALKDFVRPLVERGVPTVDIVDAALRAGVTRSRGSVYVTASRLRRNEFGRAPLVRGLGGYSPISERVHAYLGDVAGEYGVSVTELRERLLTAICDDDLAHAVLGDPPPKRRFSRTSQTEDA